MSSSLRYEALRENMFPKGESRNNTMVSIFVKLNNARPEWIIKLSPKQRIKKYTQEFIIIEGMIVEESGDTVRMNVFFRTPAISVDGVFLNENNRVLKNVVCNPRYIPYEPNISDLVVMESFTFSKKDVVSIKMLHELFPEEDREFAVNQLSGFKGITNKVDTSKGTWEIKFKRLFVYYDPVLYEYY